MELKRKLAFEVCTYLGLTENSFDSIYLNMWRNIREDGGYRLTERGYEWLHELGLKSHLITLANDNSKQELRTGNILLSLDRYLKAPYFIKNNKLNIFDDSISTQLLLYGGDIKAYIDANS
jgi:hypothetical protein